MDGTRRGTRRAAAVRRPGRLFPGDAGRRETRPRVSGRRRADGVHDEQSADDNRWRRCDLKTISLVGNVLMRQLAADADAIETVMFRDGWLTEASASNVLIVAGGVIVAPPKDNLILPGITYDAAEEFAREAGLPFEQRPVARAEALAADEMWLS